ncbi:FcoT family thioesterase [Pelatocladus sp. BLCC-F211]|uniref:FcoT family thioesterase n=1 Tax=Pelatocladus sp. BLCC-F211 TaxID=3342752 RepID=UPI0035BB2953
MWIPQNSSKETVKLNSIWVNNDDILLAQVLKPYKAHCKYLKSAEVIQEGDPQDRGRVIGRCEFAIPESCYIDDTGHFNSVEFNICYNQMMYYVIAKSVKERLMTSFYSWTMADYWAKQLPDIYIVNFESVFRYAMQSRQFRGEIEFTNIRVRSGLMYIVTKCRYWDDQGGNCSGNVKLAIVNPPV